MQFNKIKNILITVLTIIVIILLFGLFRSCDNNKSSDKLIVALQDTMHKSRNKLNQEITSKRSLETNYRTLRDLSSAQDSTIKKLQDVVDKKTQTAIYFSNLSKNKGSSKTIIKFDTLYIDSLINNPCDNFPIYETSWNERWSKGFIRATKDSVQREFMLFNEYSLTEKWTRKNIFKPYHVEVTVLNHNPNTETTNLNSFTFNPPKKRGLGKYIIGGVVGAVTMFFILK